MHIYREPVDKSILSVVSYANNAHKHSNLQVTFALNDVITRQFAARARMPVYIYMLITSSLLHDSHGIYHTTTRARVRVCI